MAVYAISDLHISDGDKPMDVFGAHWDNHIARIEENWRKCITDDDIVLMPGDMSWAMQLGGAVSHLSMVGSWPGRKIITRGNHDYWWSAIGKVRAALPDTMYAVQNDAICLDGMLFCGSRGWLKPETDEDRKIYERELIRLEMSLRKARAISESGVLTAMLHYPPVTEDGGDTPYSALLEEYGVSHVVYGHLHGSAIRNAFAGMKNGIDYSLVSCDALDFAPKMIF